MQAVNFTLIKLSNYTACFILKLYMKIHLIDYMKIHNLCLNEALWFHQHSSNFYVLSSHEVQCSLKFEIRQKFSLLELLSMK